VLCIVVNLELEAWDAAAAGCNLDQQLEIIGSQQPEIKPGSAGKTVRPPAIADLH